jgi:hypothetical protein
MDHEDHGPTRTERTGLLVISALFVAFGLFWSHAATQIPERTSFNAIPPSLLPFWAGLFFAFMGAVIFIGAWRSAPSDRALTEEEAELAVDRKGLIRVGLMMAGLLVFILFFEKIHYAITTFFITAVGLAIAGEPIRPRLFIVAAAIAGSFFLIFIYWLKVPLPGSRYF